jgi:hypothetical protein
LVKVVFSRDVLARVSFARVSLVAVSLTAASVSPAKASPRDRAENANRSIIVTGIGFFISTPLCIFALI